MSSFSDAIIIEAKQTREEVGLSIEVTVGGEWVVQQQIDLPSFYKFDVRDDEMVISYTDSSIIDVYLFNSTHWVAIIGYKFKKKKKTFSRLI